MTSPQDTPSSDTCMPEFSGSAHVDRISGQVGVNREVEAHFGQVESSPRTSAVQHSFGPLEDISSPSSPSPSQRPTPGFTSRSERALDNMDQSTPGAFPSSETLKKKKEERVRAEAEAGPPQSTAEEVKHVVEALGDYAKEYLPASLGAYIGGAKSGEKTESGGQGDAGHTAKYAETESMSMEKTSSSRNGTGTEPSKVSEPAVATLPEEKRFNVMTRSRSGDGAYPASGKAPTGGVGSLPGTPNEPAVAVLPEERQHAGEICTIDSHAPQSTFPYRAVPATPVVFYHPATASTPHPTNPFRSPEFMRTHGTRASQEGVSHEQHPQREHGDTEIHRSPQDAPPQHRDTGRNVRGASISDVSRMQMTPTRISPSTARPSGYVNEPSASNVRYIDTTHPPDRSYDVVEAPVTGSYAGGNGEAFHPQDVSSGFGSGARPAAHLEPITTARAVPSTAEPPLAVYTSVPEPQIPSIKAVGVGTAVATGAHQPTSTEHGTNLFPVGLAPHEGAMPTPTSAQAPTPGRSSPTRNQGRGGETSRSVSRGRTRKGKMGQKVKEELREAEVEVKEKSRGLFPRLSGFFRRKSPSKRERSSREASPSSPPPRKGGEYDQERNTTDESSTREATSISSGAGGLQDTSPNADAMALPEKRTPPHSDAPAGPITTVSSLPGATGQPEVASRPEDKKVATSTHETFHTSRPGMGTLPVRIAEGTVVNPPHPRRHSYSGIIPKRVPAHFDETIGPLPSHVEKRGKKELPTREKPGGSRVGVGSLPGRRDEVGVARLPDERNVMSGAFIGPQSFISTQETAPTERQQLPGAMPSQDLSIPRTNMPSAPHVALGVYAPTTSVDQQPESGYPQQRGSEGQDPHQPDQGPESRRPRVIDHGVQTEDAPKTDVGAGDADSPHVGSGRVIMPEGIANVGIFSLEHARKDQEERQKQIESGQRKTIFNAEEPSTEPIGHVFMPNMPATRTPLNRAPLETCTETPAPSPRSDSEIHTADTQSTTEKVAPATCNTGMHSSPRDVLPPASAVSIPEQRSVPLGMEPGIANIPPNPRSTSRSTFSPITSSEQRPSGRSSMSSSSSQPSPASLAGRTASSSGLGKSDTAHGGFLSELGEVISDVGDVARYYVPGAGYLLSHHPEPEVPTSREPQSASQASVNKRSPTPTAAPPIRTPPSSPTLGTQAERQDVELEHELNRNIVPAATAASQPLAPASQRLAAPRAPTLGQPDQPPTPLDPSSHPSRSSSAEELRPELIPLGPRSTRKQISGKQADIVNPLKREYVKSVMDEDKAELGTEGTLPGYPGAAGLSALIGERIYDDRMRSDGAVEPIQTTTNTLLRQPHLEPQQPHSDPAPEIPTQIAHAPPQTKHISEGSPHISEDGSQRLPLGNRAVQSEPGQHDPPHSASSQRPPRVEHRKGISVSDLGTPVSTASQGRRRHSDLQVGEQKMWRN